MKIELKNVKINKMFSEETICFKADVYINGKKIAFAENDGRGGCTFYYAYDISNGRQVLKEAEEYAKTLPSIKYNFGDEIHEITMTLEHFIDTAINDIFNGKEKAKEDKKIKKLTEKAIVFGNPNGSTYRYIQFKHTIKELKENHTGRIVLEKTINRVKGELKEGEVIFNTNL